VSEAACAQRSQACPAPRTNKAPARLTDRHASPRLASRCGDGGHVWALRELAGWSQRQRTTTRRFVAEDATVSNQGLQQAAQAAQQKHAQRRKKEAVGARVKTAAKQAKGSTRQQQPKGAAAAAASMAARRPQRPAAVVWEEELRLGGTVPEAALASWLAAPSGHRSGGGTRRPPKPSTLRGYARCVRQVIREPSLFPGLRAGELLGAEATCEAVRRSAKNKQGGGFHHAGLRKFLEYHWPPRLSSFS
jgi:hypothetical protein